MRREIESRNFEQAESLWMESLEGELAPTAEYLESAKLLRKAGERPMADTLLDLLAEALLEREAWIDRLQVLKEIGRLARKPLAMKDAFQEALRKAYGDKPHFEAVMQTIGLADGNPAEKAEKIETWLRYDEGGIFFMSGRGVGIVTELNPGLGVARLDFEKEKRFPVPLGAAPKFLEPLGEHHVLRRKITDPEGLRKDALGDPKGMLEKILRGFGRPLTQSEVRDSMAGTVPDSKWLSWWGAARKNQQVVMAGKGVKATYSWQESTGAADEMIRKRFDKSKLPQKRALAKRHSGRNKELSNYFSASLAREVEAIAESDPATAWETLATLDRLEGVFDTTLDRDELLLHAAETRGIAEITERALREAATSRIREIDEEWPRLYADLFFSEEDPRVLDVMMDHLEQAGEETVRTRLLDEILRYPRRRPKQFYWYCRRLQAAEDLPDRADFNLIYQLLELLSAEESASERAKIKEFFDKGSLAIRIAMLRDEPEEARKLAESIERHGHLEEYRREYLKAALQMKHTALRETGEEDAIFATLESVQRKRQELEQLRSVEMPANLKALQEAREMGDLRENFEYKSARQKQEYLTARVASLSAELSRVRILDAANVDTSRVRVGTRLKLRGNKGEREIAILGPWESDPEAGIYSHESEAAAAILGRSRGETISLFGDEYVIEEIEPWSEKSS
jgi:transcription elongation GreA/GreB family factor